MSFMSLFAELGLDWSPFKRGLSGAKTAATAWGKDVQNELQSKVMAAFGGAFSGAALVTGGETLVRRFVGKAIEIKSLSRELGLTTDQVQRLQRAASKEHIDFSEFSTALERVNTQRKEAAEGNKGLRETFQRLGVSLADLQDPMLSDFDILLKLAHAVEHEATPAIRAFFKELAGKGAGSLIPALSRLKEDFQPLKKETIESIYEAKRALEDLERSALRMASKPLGAMAEFFNDDPWGRTTDYLLWKIQGVRPRKRTRPAMPGPLPGDPNFIGPMQPEGNLYKDALAIQEKKKIFEAQKELKDAMEKAAYELMGPTDKASFLKSKRARLMFDAENMEDVGAVDEAMKSRKEAVEAESELQQLRNQTGDKASAEYKALIDFMKPSGPLVSYGNFLGSDPNRDMLSGIDLQIAVLERIEAAIKTRNNVGGGFFPDQP